MAQMQQGAGGDTAGCRGLRYPGDAAGSWQPGLAGAGLRVQLGAGRGQGAAPGLSLRLLWVPRIWGWGVCPAKGQQSARHPVRAAPPAPSQMLCSAPALWVEGLRASLGGLRGCWSGTGRGGPLGWHPPGWPQRFPPGQEAFAKCLRCRHHLRGLGRHRLRSSENSPPVPHFCGDGDSSQPYNWGHRVCRGSARSGGPGVPSCPVPSSWLRLLKFWGQQLWNLPFWVRLRFLWQVRGRSWGSRSPPCGFCGADGAGSVLSGGGDGG